MIYVHVDFQVHDRLNEIHDVRLKYLLHTVFGGSGKSHLAAVYHMRFTVLEHHFEVDDGETRYDSLRIRQVKLLLHRLYIFCGNARAHDFIHELVDKNIFVRVGVCDWLQVAYDSSELPSPSTLFLVQEIKVLLFRDNFSVIDNGFAQLHIYFVLPSESLVVNLQMQLPHSRNDELIRFLVHVELKGWVLVLKLLQDFDQLVQLLVFFGGEGNVYDRVGYEHTVQI